MSVRKVNEGVRGWNSKMPFPKDRYTLRCIEEDVSPSKASGNPMVTRVWEIVRSEPVQIGDKSVDVDGLKITQRSVVKIKTDDGNAWDTEKSEKAFTRFSDELMRMGFDPSGEIDDENPPAFAKGKVVDAIVRANKDVARRTPTPEQVRKGQMFGDPIKDADGKEIATYQLQIEEILGLSSVETNRPY